MVEIQLIIKKKVKLFTNAKYFNKFVLILSNSFKKLNLINLNNNLIVQENKKNILSNKKYFWLKLLKFMLIPIKNYYNNNNINFNLIEFKYLSKKIEKISNILFEISKNYEIKINELILLYIYLSKKKIIDEKLPNFHLIKISVEEKYKITNILLKFQKVVIKKEKNIKIEKSLVNPFLIKFNYPLYYEHNDNDDDNFNFNNLSFKFRQVLKNHNFFFYKKDKHKIKIKKNRNLSESKKNEFYNNNNNDNNNNNNNNNNNSLNKLFYANKSRNKSYNYFFHKKNSITNNSEIFDMTSTNYFPSINNNNNISKYSSLKSKNTMKLIKKTKKNKNTFNINNNKLNNYKLFLTNSQKFLKRNFSRDKLYSKNSFRNFTNNYLTKNDLYYK